MSDAICKQVFQLKWVVYLREIWCQVEGESYVINRLSYLLCAIKEWFHM